MKFGTPKSLDDITMEDVLEHPIWSPVWAIGMEEDYPEDYQAPLLNENDLDEEIDQPVIALTVEGTDLIASGEFDWEKEMLTTFAIWNDDQWLLPSDLELPTPLYLVSIPKIQGQSNVRFECLDLSSETAKLVE
ncbi:MAG: hypothetical protein COA79_21665 [Planctomycetota bacterium]|nr:MAG: hypothetical protein COA79_21665 [Planctomycetota bacterium]